MSNDKPDLILFPCCQSKNGNAQMVDRKCVADSICQEMYDLLSEGRHLAFQRPGVGKDEKSPLILALDLYTGRPYAVDGFRECILKALDKKCHCLIVSGGYGFLRPEEPIHRYNARISQTSSVWRSRLSKVLTDYLVRNRIRTVFVACSRQYFDVLKANTWARHVEGAYCYVPSIPRGQGNAYSEVPERIGQAVTALVGMRMTPDERWVPLRPSSSD